MPFDEDEYQAWCGWMDHIKGPEGEPQWACITCNEAKSFEDLCCGGYPLWAAMPKSLRERMLKMVEDGLTDESAK
jgi:hypothetical protein